MNPDGLQLSRLDPHVFNTCVNGIAIGYIAPADQAWYAAHGPDILLSKVKIPTLITQGTADTLFTLKEAIRNYASLRSRGVPTKMLWFCGGHGVCLTGSRRGRPHRARGARPGSRATSSATPRCRPARASSGWPTTPSGARRRTTRSRAAAR